MRVPWTSFERRWRDALCAAMIPGAGDPLPGADARFWREYAASAPALVRLGFRTAVWALALSPPLVLGSPATFDRLDADARDQLLARMAGSRWYLARQLVLAVKLTACLAHLRDEQARARVEAQQ